MKKKTISKTLRETQKENTFRANDPPKLKRAGDNKKNFTSSQQDSNDLQKVSYSLGFLFPSKMKRESKKMKPIKQMRVAYTFKPLPSPLLDHNKQKKAKILPF